MKDGFVCVDVLSLYPSLVDYNKRFLQMVHNTLMFDDGGG
jgi:hypothetical protein